MEILNKIRYVLNLNKAFSKNEKGKYKDSISILKKLENFAKEHKDALPDYYILYGENLARLGECSKAQEYFLQSINILDTSKHFNNDEVSYLKTYLTFWIPFLEKCSEEIEEELKVLLNSEFEFDLDKVRRSLKINFPIDFAIKVR